jgi:hypothetical protein
MFSPGQDLTSSYLSRLRSFLKADAFPWSISLLFFFVCGMSIACGRPVLADGGGPLPTSTTGLSTPSLATSLPSPQLTATFLPGLMYPAPVSGTAEVKSFEIIIDSNQNATVQAVTPAGQAALSRADALEAQANTPTQPEKFASPLWVFGFITIVIIIAALNAAAKGMRKGA